MSNLLKFGGMRQRAPAPRPIGRATCILLAAAGLGMLGLLVSCATAPDAFPVNGPEQTLNDPPTLTIDEPDTNVTIAQGSFFLIEWEDTDGDDDAQISFTLVSTVSSQQVQLAAGISENDRADSLAVDTTLVPTGTFNLMGTISDGVNADVEVFALTGATGSSARVVITVTPPGQGPVTQPPIVAVVQPAFNRSVAQDDVVQIVIQPAINVQPGTVAPPFDPDSGAVLFVLADLNLDPTDDDPANPDPDEIILLTERILVDAGDAAPVDLDIEIDTSTIPPRPNGEPYFIRATISDGTNPPVHSYAPGTLSVVQLAAGTVDLFDIGRTKSGARFQGFNPGANVGSSVSAAQDFDVDGAEDFVLVAQFGNPQNVGPVGEAYLIYGQPGGANGEPGIRFGGTIPVNSIASTVSGCVFQAPPVRSAALPFAGAHTDGITSVSFVPDVTGDNRPEIIFGLPHVHGAYDSLDFDQGDQPPPDAPPENCYPDPFVNNFSDTDQADPFDVQFYAGGMAVVVNSTNRDIDPEFNSPAALRLESTTISLEFSGQTSEIFLDGNGLSGSGFIFPVADNSSIEQADRGNDPEGNNRISGFRIVGGYFDDIDASGLSQPPREDSFGHHVASVGDLTVDGLDEIIVSAPTNERYLRDLSVTLGFTSTQLASTIYTGSILILPGTNYNTVGFRDTNDDDGTSTVPVIDNARFDSNCDPPDARSFFIPADAMEVFAEDIDDYLGGAESAGDFNQDGVGDVLCGAPLNDRSNSLLDSGAVYVLYGRANMGSVNLTLAEDPILRYPMLRVRGVRIGDQIGWRQTSGRDVNGDRIDDIFISSPRTDFGGVFRETCGEDLNADGVLTTADFPIGTFNSCEENFGAEVFSDDSCKAFDYDNDGDIDEEDRCVFCCLSNDCQPDAACVHGRDANDCCDEVVDNGFVGIVFGGVFINGDRDLSQLATSQLPGAIFFGAHALDRAGYGASSAGDFNKDGFGDVLISAPGETRTDSAGRVRQGVVYVIFGGTHLINTIWNLSVVGSEDLPGIVFLSPYVTGRPNEAAPTTVGAIGDVNDDGFGDIAIGNPLADFIDPSFPQGPEAPGDDPAAGRRRDVGDTYIIYGNNFGSNQAVP